MVTSAPVPTIGYYRYADIMFYWADSILDDKVREALKAMLNPESLVDIDNPLRASDPKGMKFWLGAFPSGEQRLLFSSAQVEYVRYYIHATGFISDPSQLPLPDSSYMLVPSPDLTISPAYHTDARVLRKHPREIEKSNKKILKADPKLAMLRKGFEKIRNAWSQGYGTWISIDFEAWEMENSMITEFGWTMVKWDGKGKMGPIEDGHLIVKEYTMYRNGKYVPDEQEHFLFGTSEVVPKTIFQERIKSLLTASASTGPLFLIFHDAKMDLKYLESIGIPRFVDAFNIPDTPPQRGQYVVDTSLMFAGLDGNPNGKVGLARACRLLGVKDTRNMHNAGNDAHFTFLVFQEMASGSPVDLQREERWPSEKRKEQSTDPAAALEVKFNSDDEISDGEKFLF